MACPLTDDHCACFYRGEKCCHCAADNEPQAGDVPLVHPLSKRRTLPLITLAVFAVEGGWRRND